MGPASSGRSTRHVTPARQYSEDAQCRHNGAAGFCAIADESTNRGDDILDGGRGSRSCRLYVRCRRHAPAVGTPEIGQHNDEVLAEIGYDAAGIAALKAAGVLGPK